MPDSLLKISRGLDARRRLKDGLENSPLNGLIGAPRNVPAMLDMLKSATMKADRYREFSTGFRNRLAAYADKRTAEVAKFPNLSKDQRREIVRADVEAERKRMLSEGPDSLTFKDRERIRVELVEMRRLMVAVKSDWRSSVGAIMRASLGSELRRRFAEDVATSGPHEIDGYLREAIKRGGEEGEALAAAVFARMDALAESAPDVRSRVTVDKGEVADLLIGARCIAARQAIEAVEILHDEIGIEAIELQGGEVSQLARDALRMRKHNFDAQFPKDEPKPENDAA